MNDAARWAKLPCHDVTAGEIIMNEGSSDDESMKEGSSDDEITDITLSDGDSLNEEDYEYFKSRYNNQGTRNSLKNMVKERARDQYYHRQILLLYRDAEQLRIRRGAAIRLCEKPRTRFTEVICAMWSIVEVLFDASVTMNTSLSDQEWFLRLIAAAGFFYADYARCMHSLGCTPTSLGRVSLPLQPPFIINIWEDDEEPKTDWHRQEVTRLIAFVFRALKTIADHEYDHQVPFPFKSTPTDRWFGMGMAAEVNYSDFVGDELKDGSMFWPLQGDAPVLLCLILDYRDWIDKNGSKNLWRDIQHQHLSEDAHEVTTIQPFFLGMFLLQRLVGNAFTIVFS